MSASSGFVILTMCVYTVYLCGDLNAEFPEMNINPDWRLCACVDFVINNLDCIYSDRCLL